MLDPQASFCGESSGGVTNCPVVDPGKGPAPPNYSETKLRPKRFFGDPPVLLPEGLDPPLLSAVFFYARIFKIRTLQV